MVDSFCGCVLWKLCRSLTSVGCMQLFIMFWIACKVFFIRDGLNITNCKFRSFKCIFFLKFWFLIVNPTFYFWIYVCRNDHSVMISALDHYTSWLGFDTYWGKKIIWLLDSHSYLMRQWQTSEWYLPYNISLLCSQPALNCRSHTHVWESIAYTLHIYEQRYRPWK